MAILMSAALHSMATHPEGGEPIIALQDPLGLNDKKPTLKDGAGSEQAENVLKKFGVSAAAPRLRRHREFLARERNAPIPG